ncbi:MAG: DNA/RNA non-specific endonuclease [Hyphomonadaceae bacterium]
MRRLLAAAVSTTLFAGFAVTQAFAVSLDCSDEFILAKPPVSPASAGQTQQLCFAEFSVLYSAMTRTPIWSAEHLTADDVRAARATPRVDSFHEEQAIAKSLRSATTDYARSGFDRGHMTPSGDMRDPQAQRESFSMANMAPQAPGLNRGLWEEIESAARDLALASGEVYVVTGPIFAGQPQKLKDRVTVPAGFFKAIYDPQRRQAGAYVVDNREGARYSTMSIAQLAQLTGFDAFPALPAGVKSRTMNLPKPIGETPTVSAEAGFATAGGTFSYRY